MSGDSLLWEGVTLASTLVDMMDMAHQGRKGSPVGAWMQDDQALALADPPHLLEVTLIVIISSRFKDTPCKPCSLQLPFPECFVMCKGMQQAPAVFRVVLFLRGWLPSLSLSTSSMVSMSSALALLSLGTPRLEAGCLSSLGDLALGPLEGAALMPVSSSSLIRSGRDSESSSRDELPACLAAAPPGAPAGTFMSTLPTVHTKTRWTVG